MTVMTFICHLPCDRNCTIRCSCYSRFTDEKSEGTKGMEELCELPEIA